MKQHNAQETLDVQQNKEPSSDVKSKKEEAITERKSAEGNQTQENHTKHLKEREPVRKTTPARSSRGKKTGSSSITIANERTREKKQS